MEKIEDKLCVNAKNNGEIDILRIKDDKAPRTVWYGTRYDANAYGSKLVNKMTDGKKFSFPKSLYTIYDCLYSVVANDKNAIILDYHAGSGTSAHAVFELNKEDGGNRKFIMVEQMDYTHTVTCPRVQKVLEKEKIDDSFIYFELAKWNEIAKEKILACETLEDLENFFAEMCETYFLNYNFKIREFKDTVLKEENFRNLPLNEQKRLFITMLDNNEMYVNKTEMADTKYNLHENDQELTQAFYDSSEKMNHGK